MRWPLITSDGVRLEVVEFGGDDSDDGSGARIVLLHGLMGRATTWWPVAQGLLDRGRVFGPDARNHGRSAHGGDRSPERMALDVVELLEHTGPAALVGHSMGGLSALLAAARRPELVTALVVEDMAVDLTGLPPGTVTDMHAWFSAIPQPLASLAAVREAFGHPYPEAGEYMTECVEERPGPGAGGYHLLTAVDDATATAAHWTRTAHWDALDAVRAPTLFVEAEHSIVPPGQMEAMARRIPGARHVRIPDTGHLVHAAAPDVWLDAVRDLLRSR